jgi:hypothetical protein
MLSHMQAHYLTEGTAPILSKCKVMRPKGALFTGRAAVTQQTTTSHPTDGVTYLNWAGAAGAPYLIFADRSEAARVDEAGIAAHRRRIADTEAARRHLLQHNHSSTLPFRVLTQLLEKRIAPHGGARGYTHVSLLNSPHRVLLREDIATTKCGQILNAILRLLRSEDASTIIIH